MIFKVLEKNTDLHSCLYNAKLCLCLLEKSKVFFVFPDCIADKYEPVFPRVAARSALLSGFTLQLCLEESNGAAEVSLSAERGGGNSDSLHHSENSKSPSALSPSSAPLTPLSPKESD